MTNGLQAFRRSTPTCLALVTSITTGLGISGSAMIGFFGPLQAVYVTAAFTGIAGALIAARQPKNSVGWLMVGMSLFTALSIAPFDYGYWSLRSGFGPHGLAVAATWVASWAWIVPFGLAFPLILARFPSGRLAGHWLIVDRLSLAGTGLVVFATAFRPGAMYPLETVGNPFAIHAPTVMEISWYAGLISLVTSDAVAVASIVVRLRRARGDERQQLKWIGSAAVLIVVAIAFAAVANLLFNAPLLLAMVPFSITSLVLPVAIGVAVLRYRLYDIDLIINKAFVFGGLTAILAGLYTLMIGLSERVLTYTGQKSDAELLLTAFVVASAFTPVKGWLERWADRRIGPRDAAATLVNFAERIESVVAVLEAEPIVRGLVQESVRTLGTSGAELTITGGGALAAAYRQGRVERPSAVVELRAAGKAVGRMTLGSRHGRHGYSDRELAALHRAADAVGEVIDMSVRRRASTRMPSEKPGLDLTVSVPTDQFAPAW